MQLATICSRSALFFFTLGVCLVGACGSKKSPPKPPSPVTNPSQPVLPKMASGLSTISDVSEAALPSVVNISTAKKAPRRRQYRSPFEQDPFFRFFSPREGFNQRPTPRKYQKSLGSGVIIDPDGTILTNQHVVEGGDIIKVTLHDGSEVSAEILGSDPTTDLAVLKLKEPPPTPLKALSFGQGKALRLGEFVIAIGNPFGVGQTVTMGIVSAKGRANVGLVDYEDFIQTDAAINPGNSGGALLNLRGELVGINTAILSKSGGYQGIGFAIPAEIVQAVLQDILQDGSIDRGYLGVSIQKLTPELAEAFDAATQQGVLVTSVEPDSPAAKSGLEAQDIILAVNGDQVSTPAELRNKIALSGAGKSVTLELLKGGERQETQVVLARHPKSTAITSTLDSDSGHQLGFKLSEITPRLRAKFRIPEEVERGLVVVAVERDSSAERSGLRMGDVIMDVNRQAITTLEDFGKAIVNDSQTQLLRIVRQGVVLFIVIHQHER